MNVHVDKMKFQSTGTVALLIWPYKINTLNIKKKIQELAHLTCYKNEVCSCKEVRKEELKKKNKKKQKRSL